jgi:hypothetical protein
MESESTERTREIYLPSQIDVLFVGESAPRSGSFFYADETNLHKATREAFSKAYATIFYRLHDFLEFFRDRRCYLDDLCQSNVNGLNHHQRRAERRLGVPKLAKRISRYQPKAIVCVMKAITPDVIEAISLSHLSLAAFHSLPFPNWSHRQIYVTELRSTIDCLRCRGLLM